MRPPGRCIIQPAQNAGRFENNRLHLPVQASVRQYGSDIRCHARGCTIDACRRRTDHHLRLSGKRSAALPVARGISRRKQSGSVASKYISPLPPGFPGGCILKFTPAKTCGDFSFIRDMFACFLHQFCYMFAVQPVSDRCVRADYADLR